jgi:pilus assembly protein CpaB
MFFRNLLLALGVLTLIAGLSLAVVWFIQSDRIAVTEPEASAPVAQPAILVASRAISSGSLLRADDITAQEIRGADIRPGSLMRGQESEFEGAVTRRDFALGAPLIASDFVKTNERGFLAAVLKPGTRAVSISVDASQSASGLILPGDRVDVILIQSFGDPTEPARKEVAETVLIDVRVLAVDQSLGTTPKAEPADKRPGNPESQLPKTVTLEVSPRQAETLLVAGQLGRLGVAVRALENSGGPAAPGGTAPTWASDVSPALKQMRTGVREQRPFTTGSSIETSIRTVPPRGVTIAAPAAAEVGSGVRIAAPEDSVSAKAKKGATQ